MQFQNIQTLKTPERHKDIHRLSILRTTLKERNRPINFSILFSKYFIKEENKINLKKYLVELYHDLSHFSPNEEKGISYDTFIYYLNMPIPVAANIFKLLDKDKNNYLNLEEFCFGLFDIYGTNDFYQLSNFVFNLIDTDKDGLITKEDIQLLLSYLPLERNLRNKLMQRDYYNINFDDIVKNQKLIESTLHNVYNTKNFLTQETFNYSIQKINSDIFVAILIYLFEARPFNNDVLNIYSYTDYDYLSENKNCENFKKVENFFEKNEKKDKISKIKKEFNLFEGQNIEEPKIDLIKDLNSIKKIMRANQKNFTFMKKSNFSFNKKNKSNKNIISLNDRSKQKGRKSQRASFISDMKLPKEYFYKNYKKMSSGNIINLKQLINKEKSKLTLSELLKLSQTYEGTVFKITNEGRLKSYYLKLILNDIFYYKSKDDKFHAGMHHLTNDIVLSKNKKQKYKSIWLYSLSIITQEKKYTFYFDKEEICFKWYKHFQKAVLFRKLDEIFILGEKIKSDKIQTISNIRFKDTMSYNPFLELKEKKYICIQIIKAGNNLSKKLNESIFNQVSVHQICYHKNIPKLIDIFQDEKYFYIIKEKYNKDNDVLRYLQNLDIHNPFKEEEKVCEIIHQLLIAVYYLHKMGIMHRNIKPDCIIANPQTQSEHEESFSSSGNNSYISETNNNNNIDMINVYSNIKLIDASLAKFLNINQKVKEPYGTVGYLSPELLSAQAYDFLIDEWSIGIVTHLLLCGKLPFSDEYSEREIARQTIHEKLTFEQPKWEKLSKESKDFVSKLLIKDPKKRMKVKNALVHPWIKKYYPIIVEKRMKSFDTNTPREDNYEFEYFCAPVDNIKD